MKTLDMEAGYDLLDRLLQSILLRLSEAADEAGEQRPDDKQAREKAWVSGIARIASCFCKVAEVNSKMSEFGSSVAAGSPGAFAVLATHDAAAELVVWIRKRAATVREATASSNDPTLSSIIGEATGDKIHELVEQIHQKGELRSDRQPPSVGPVN